MFTAHSKSRSSKSKARENGSSIQSVNGRTFINTRRDLPKPTGRVPLQLKLVYPGEMGNGSSKQRSNGAVASTSNNNNTRKRRSSTEEPPTRSKQKPDTLDAYFPRRFAEAEDDIPARPKVKPKILTKTTSLPNAPVGRRFEQQERSPAVEQSYQEFQFSDPRSFQCEAGPSTLPSTAVPTSAIPAYHLPLMPLPNVGHNMIDVTHSVYGFGEAALQLAQTSPAPAAKKRRLVVQTSSPVREPEVLAGPSSSSALRDTTRKVDSIAHASGIQTCSPTHHTRQRSTSSVTECSPIRTTKAASAIVPTTAVEQLDDSTSSPRAASHHRCGSRIAWDTQDTFEQRRINRSLSEIMVEEQLIGRRLAGELPTAHAEVTDYMAAYRDEVYTQAESSVGTSTLNHYRLLLGVSPRAKRAKLPARPRLSPEPVVNDAVTVVQQSEGTPAETKDDVDVVSDSETEASDADFSWMVQPPAWVSLTKRKREAEDSGFDELDSGVLHSEASTFGFGDILAHDSAPGDAREVPLAEHLSPTPTLRPARLLPAEDMAQTMSLPPASIGTQATLPSQAPAASQSQVFSQTYIPRVLAPDSQAATQTETQDMLAMETECVIRKTGPVDRSLTDAINAAWFGDVTVNDSKTALEQTTLGDFFAPKAQRGCPDEQSDIAQRTLLDAIQESSVFGGARRAPVLDVIAHQQDIREVDSEATECTQIVPSSQTQFIPASLVTFDDVFDFDIEEPAEVVPPVEEICDSDGDDDAVEDGISAKIITPLKRSCEAWLLNSPMSTPSPVKKCRRTRA